MHFSGVLLQESFMKRSGKITSRVKNHTKTKSQILLHDNPACTKHIFEMLVLLVPFHDGAAPLALYEVFV